MGMERTGEIWPWGMVRVGRSGGQVTREMVLYVVVVRTVDYSSAYIQSHTPRSLHSQPLLRILITLFHCV